MLQESMGGGGCARRERVCDSQCPSINTEEEKKIKVGKICDQISWIGCLPKPEIQEAVKIELGRVREDGASVCVCV